MMGTYIPFATRKRIPIYYKMLKHLLNDGVEKIKSEELAEIIHIDSRTIRKDFSRLGTFGTRGKGYTLAKIVDIFETEFDLKVLEPVTLIGLGHLGMAISQYYLDQTSVSRLVQIYEVDNDLINTKHNGIDILDYKTIKDTHDNESCIAILAVPASQAQIVFDELVELGFTGFINFTGSKIFSNKKNVVINDIDLMQVIQSLIYDLRVDY